MTRMLYRVRGLVITSEDRKVSEKYQLEPLETAEDSSIVGVICPSREIHPAILFSPPPLPPASAVEVIKLVSSVCVCLGVWDLHCSPPCDYRTTLCTIDLRCAPPTCVVHHGEQGGTMSVRCGGHPRHLFWQYLGQVRFRTSHVSGGGHDIK